MLRRIGLFITRQQLASSSAIRLRHHSLHRSYSNHASFTMRVLTHARNNAGEYLALGALSSMLGIFGYMNYLIYRKDRERVIINKPYNTNEHRLVVDNNDFESLAKTEHGSLGSCYVCDKNTGEMFVRKGAQSEDDLIKEIVLASVFNKLLPDNQTVSYLLQRDLGESSDVRFYSLSRMHAHSMDMEDFVRKMDWKNELQSCPLVDFEKVLALAPLSAGQQDLKLANIVIYKSVLDNGMPCYRAHLIDYEKFGKHIMRMFSHNHLATDLNELAGMVRDVMPDDGDNTAGMAGDPRAIEFMNLAKSQMKKEAVIDMYREVAAMNPNAIMDDILKDLVTSDGLIRDKHYKLYLNELWKMKNMAEEFVEKLDCDIQNRENIRRRK